MYQLRSITGVDDFIDQVRDPPAFADQVRRLFDSEASRAGWCFLLEDGARRLGRIGYRVEPTADPARLGSLPPAELFAFGWSQDWTLDPLLTAGELFLGTLAQIASQVPAVLDVRINPEVHDAVDARRRALESLGFELFQEKQGFAWAVDGNAWPQPPARITVRSIVEIGPDAYIDLLAGAATGTLDRSDRYYQSHMTPAEWATEMLGYLDPFDAPLWLAGYEATGEPVGYVAVSGFDEPTTATIIHIGVLPAARGHGYVDELLAAGTRAGLEAGYRFMLNDVDVENAPMIAAFRRAGHREDIRPWHVWHYRADVARLAMGRSRLPVLSSTRRPA